MLPRTGWLRAGIEHPESVAEQSLRAAMLAWMLAGLEGADPERAATLALFHDSQEVARPTSTTWPGATCTRPPTSRSRPTRPRRSPALASRLCGLVAEYEGRASLEADCARDADKLEILLQALDCRAQGHRNTEPFMETALAALRTHWVAGSARPR